VPFPAYCEQQADGGGWTLVLKVDGRDPRFYAYQDLWVSRDLLNAANPALDRTVGKLHGFTRLKAKELRVGLADPASPTSTVRWLTATLTTGTDQTLQELFDRGDYVPLSTPAGASSWLGLLPGSALQANCRREGLNNSGSGGAAYVRIGIIANNEADCLSPDSWVGVGGIPISCVTTTLTTAAAGNAALCLGGSPTIDAAAFAYVMVR
jgi:hypothetical protein